MVGKKLTKALIDSGHEVRHLSRSSDPNSSIPIFQWNINSGTIDPKAVIGIDHIVHLAGAPIVDKKWTKARVEELIRSRAQSAGLLLSAVKDQRVPLKGFHSASGINIYGAQPSDHVFTEEDIAGNDTIARITAEWEESVRKFESICRTVRFRIGVILSPDGGALPKLAYPIRYWIGSPLGTGKQWVPWIHLDDVVRLFVRSIEDETMSGAYNAVSEEHIRNRDLAKAIAHALDKPFWAPNVPGFVLRILLGERSDLVLNGYRASNRKLQESGFEFKRKSIAEALEDAF